MLQTSRKYSGEIHSRRFDTKKKFTRLMKERNVR